MTVVSSDRLLVDRIVIVRRCEARRAQVSVMSAPPDLVTSSGGPPVVSGTRPGGEMVRSIVSCHPFHGIVSQRLACAKGVLAEAYRRRMRQW